MKRITIVMIGLMTTLTTATFAQESTTKTPSQRGLSLSVGPEFILPIGTFKSESGYKFGLGGSAKLVLPLASNWDGTVSAGYIGFSQSKLDSVASKNTFTTIPFKAGIRYRADGGFYVEPQAGFTQTKVTNQEGSGQFTYALNLGYLINDMFDISARYEAINAKDETISGVTVKGISAKMLGLRLAYNFNFARSK